MPEASTTRSENATDVHSRTPTGGQSLPGDYRSVREVSLKLCAPLTVEDHSLQAMPDASPAKWHLAHTTWFFETFLLSEHLPGSRPVNPAFRSLFNSYYNSVGDRPLRALRHVLSRPSLDEVRAYRAQVDGAMERLLSQGWARGVRGPLGLGVNTGQQR